MKKEIEPVERIPGKNQDKRQAHQDMIGTHLGKRHT
jgi:hypothetical protein